MIKVNSYSLVLIGLIVRFLRNPEGAEREEILTNINRLADNLTYLNFAVTLALTPLFPPPNDKVQKMIDAVREPEGEGPALEMESAIDH